MNEKWFNLDLPQVEKKLKTNAATGLSRKAARSRVDMGAGQLFYAERKSTLRMFIELFADIALIILLLGAIFSLFFEIEEYLRGFTLLILIVTELSVCGLMYFRTQRMLESLTSLFYPMARVIRNGRLFHVDGRSLVKGDVILLQRGDVLCCDARLVTSDGLKVRMRVDKEKYVELEKFAGVTVDERENRATHMTNMVHGGSVIKEGSARAIVTAVGKYTYLGAMTGGIQLPVPNKLPESLISMKKRFSKINMAMLIGVLPFTGISLLLGNLLAERTSLLSVAFLAALSIAATTLSPISCTLFGLFYSKKIRELILNKNSAVLRSVEDFDKLASADYLFVLDGSALTDGLLHFDVASSAEGEIRNYDSLGKSGKMFAEYVSLYYESATQSVSTGISGAGDLLLGVEEFVKRNGVDTGALKIRCKVRSYTPGNMTDVPEQLCFCDGNTEYRMNVYRLSSVLHKCDGAIISGVPQRLTDEGKKNIERMWKKYEIDGRTPLLFTIVSQSAPLMGECFLGMLTLKDGGDDDILKRVAMLERVGCKTIFFQRSGKAPKMPSIINELSTASKSDFLGRKLPITYGFGRFSVYSDLSDSDISELIAYVRSKGKKVTVLGFTESAVNIADHADGFITTSRIAPMVAGRLNEEIFSAEIPGEQGSASCVQTVKERAGCLVERPNGGRGGFNSLLRVFYSIRSVYRNIGDYLRYLYSMQIVRIVIIGIPMLFGDAKLDARHLLFSAFVIDIFAMLAFMGRSSSFYRRNDNDQRILSDSPFRYLKYDLSLTIASLSSSGVAVVLPRILDLIIGKYDYKVEGLFLSLLLIQIGVFFSIFYAKDLSELKNIYKNKYLLISVGAVILLLTLCFTIEPFGLLFAFTGFMSLPYFAICFVPLVIYLVVFFLLEYKKANRS